VVFDLGWLPGIHKAILLLPLPCRTGEKNEIKNLMDHDKDMEVIHPLWPWAKYTLLGKD